MTTASTASDAAHLFADARAMHGDALARLADGDIRDAAEKAWCATKRAADGLILSRTGEEPLKSPVTSRALNELASGDAAVEAILGRYYSRQAQLHGECFYLGLCEPLATTERRIRETGAFIDEAERLAEG